MVNLKVSFPNMGNAWVPFKAFLESFPGIEVILPAPMSKNTILLGNKYSPAGSCLPFKSNIGDFIGILKKEAVDVFLSLMGCGPCRFGIFHVVQEQILHDLGYNSSIIQLDQEDLLKFKWLREIEKLTQKKSKFQKIFNRTEAIRNFARKAKLVEDMENLKSYFQCRELRKGQTERTFNSLLFELDNSKTTESIREFRKQMLISFKTIGIDQEFKPLKVSLIGEIHTLMEPALNYDLKRRLGEKGLEIHQNQSFLDWILHKAHFNFRRKGPEKLALEYLKLDIGGEALWNVGEYFQAIQKGFDGFIHVYPQKCIPEIIARNIIDSNSSQKIPVMFFSIDGIGKEKEIDNRITDFHNLLERRCLKGMTIAPIKKFSNEPSILEKAEAEYGSLHGDSMDVMRNVWNIFQDLNPLNFVKEGFSKTIKSDNSKKKSTGDK